MATTTPRPIPLVKALLKDPTVVVTGGSSYENLQNLPEFYIEQVIRRFESTRLGEQEIYAQLLGDTPGALWTRDLLERTRVKELPDSNGGCKMVGRLSVPDGRLPHIRDERGSANDRRWAHL